MTATPEEILEFWFGDARASPQNVDARVELWFSKNDQFDEEIRRRFGSLPERAARGEMSEWRGHAASALALTLVLDQFPRNLFRNSARAFAFDPAARDVALSAISRRFDQTLHPVQAVFFYLPLEHAEDIELQEKGVQLFGPLIARAPEELRPLLENFASYARRHRDLIRTFGRFPHRNKILGRPSTPAEVAYLESGGDTFG